MRFRHNRKPYLFYPEDFVINFWSLFITVVLIFTCCVTPFRIAFIEEDTYTWQVINTVVDFLFLIDIIIIFNTAVQDENFELIDNRKTISCLYI